MRRVTSPTTLSNGSTFNTGLERIAEEGNITPLYEAMKGWLASDAQLGTFNTPESATAPARCAPATPIPSR